MRPISQIDDDIQATKNQINLLIERKSETVKLYKERLSLYDPSTSYDAGLLKRGLTDILSNEDIKIGNKIHFDGFNVVLAVAKIVEKGSYRSFILFPTKAMWGIHYEARNYDKILQTFMPDIKNMMMWNNINTINCGYPDSSHGFSIYGFTNNMLDLIEYDKSFMNDSLFLYEDKKGPTCGFIDSYGVFNKLTNDPTHIIPFRPFIQFRI